MMTSELRDVLCRICVQAQSLKEEKEAVEELKKVYSERSNMALPFAKEYVQREYEKIKESLRVATVIKTEREQRVGVDVADGMITTVIGENNPDGTIEIMSIIQEKENGKEN